MNKYIITVGTAWCGMDNSFGAYAKSESDLYDITDELAYENLLTYDCHSYIAEELFDDVDEMTEADWDTVYESECDYVTTDIELVETSEQEEDFENLEIVYDAREDNE